MNITPGGEVPHREPDPDDSVEDVLATLRTFDKELVASGKIAETDEVAADVFSGYISPMVDVRDAIAEAREEAAQELAWEELSEYATSLRIMLSKIGLADPASIVRENVGRVSSEVLEQLDSLNAEALFYDVARRVHRELGIEGSVTWGRLMERARPKNIDGTNGEAIDLDKLRLGQSLDNVGDLGKLGLRLNVPSIPDKQQNINRLAYVYYEEPALEALRLGLQEKAQQEEFYITIERAIELAKSALIRRLAIAEDYRKALDEQIADQHLDSIDQEVWERLSRPNKMELRRMKCSLRIIETIQESMRIDSVDELTDELTDDNGLAR